METKKPKLLNPGHTDEMYTPAYALDPLIPFLPKSRWENIGLCVCEPYPGPSRHMVNALKERGFCVVEHPHEAEMIITNPPYSKKDEILQECYDYGIPFALLLPLTALEGKKRGAMYREHGIQLIIPNRRVNFITPNGGKSAWFQVAWFTWGLNLPKDLNFVEMERT